MDEVGNEVYKGALKRYFIGADTSFEEIPFCLTKRY
jgi:hypothetical protein